MPDPNPAALDFLLTRRSRPAKTLRAPWPGRDDLAPILTAAARTPDHGKLEPWRFVVLEEGALVRLSREVKERARTLGHDDDQIEKTSRQFADAGAVITVIVSLVPSEKIPPQEQLLSAGGVCLAALNAALASGWGANWLTGWTAFDRKFLSDSLNLKDHEFVAGYIHIGTETAAPPERPRPDLTQHAARVAS